MNIAYLLYLIDTIVKIHMFLWLTFPGTALYLLIAGVASLDEPSEFLHKWLYLPIKKYIWIPIICLIISCFIPSEKTMYLMMGAEYLQNSQIPSKVELVINKKLDEYLLEDKDQKK